MEKIILSICCMLFLVSCSLKRDNRTIQIKGATPGIVVDNNSNKYQPSFGVFKDDVQLYLILVRDFNGKLVVDTIGKYEYINIMNGDTIVN